MASDSNFASVRPKDRSEWEFSIKKAEGGNVSSGDEVAIGIFPTFVTTGPYYFRVIGQDQGAYGGVIGGDGTTPFQDDTVFIAEFTEVRAGLGFRPPNLVCQVCAAVTGTVSGVGNAPVAGARVTSQGAAVNGHPFSATTGGDGRFQLEDSQQRSCIPPGPLSITVEADAYMSRSVPIIVPDQGAIDTPVQLACTEVKGKVVEAVGNSLLPMPGIEVCLTYADSGQSFLTITDPIDGTFTFQCVRHVRATVSTDYTAPQEIADPVPDIGVRNVLIVISRTCTDIEGNVTDASTGAPLADVKVTVQNTTPAGSYTINTDNQGNYSLQGVCLSGPQSLKASKQAYASQLQATNLPVSGTVRVDFQLHPIVAPGPVTPHVIDCTLAWGESLPAARDLDSHLSGPNPSTNARFHCYYSQRDPVPFVALDRDDVDWAGPEHVVIRPSQVGGQSVPVPGDYHYWVHNYSGGQSFSDSDARVTISIDGQQREQFYASGAQGDQNDRIWHVFDFAIAQDGTVVIHHVQQGGQPLQNGQLMPGSAADVL